VKKLKKHLLTKDLVIGLGEIGDPILKIVSKGFPTIGYDVDPKLMDKKKYIKFENIPTVLVHVCIPFSKTFESTIIKIEKKHTPRAIVIHSTISVKTTEVLQKKLGIPIIYSPIRGVHKRMLKDLKRYTKFYSVFDWAPHSNWASKLFVKRMNKVGIKTSKMTNPTTLELAKIVVDTSYYGWLINYAQISQMISSKHKVNYEEMWSFADEIHKFLGNRPKMFPGFIGGHCVIPNLELMNGYSLNQIKKINKSFRKFKK
jgi:UDP-N-acetyl-D-mannosaminuronate dehydrogenase